MNCSPPESITTTLVPQMYLCHTLKHPSNIYKYLGIHINNILTFDKQLSTLKAYTFHNLFNLKK